MPRAPTWHTSLCHVGIAASPRFANLNFWPSKGLALGKTIDRRLRHVAQVLLGGAVGQILQ
jgi:hypothetical protein